MEDEITKAGLQNVPGFHKKVIQMFDIFNIRFGADSASRGAAAPSRHRRDSSPGEEVCFSSLSEFGPNRDAPRRRDARGTDGRGQVDVLPYIIKNHDVAPPSGK